MDPDLYVHHRSVTTDRDADGDADGDTDGDTDGDMLGLVCNVSPGEVEKVEYDLMREVGLCTYWRADFLCGILRDLGFQACMIEEFVQDTPVLGTETTYKVKIDVGRRGTARMGVLISFELYGEIFYQCADNVASMFARVEVDLVVYDKATINLSKLLATRMGANTRDVSDRWDSAEWHGERCFSTSEEVVDFLEKYLRDDQNHGDLFECLRDTFDFVIE